MKKIIYLLALILFASCSAQFHLRQAIKKDPHLFDTLTARIDTLRLPVPEIHYVDKLIRGDTVTITQTDSVTKEVTRIKYFVRNDTITIQAKCPDQQVITKVKTVLVEKPLTKQIKNKYRKQGVAGILILEVLILIAILTRKLWMPLITGGWSKLTGIFK